MPRRIVMLVIIAILIPALSARSQTVMALKTGEATTGMTKQCYYNALGNKYTLTVRSIDLCPLNTQVRLNPSTAANEAPAANRWKPKEATAPAAPADPGPQPATITALKSGERTTGMTKQCYYNALGNSYTKTVSSVDLCPLSVKVSLTQP